jgi:hypothetical protein
LKDKYGFDYASKSGVNYLNDFLMTLVIKVGAQDIQNNKVTASLILNETMLLMEDKKDPLDKVKQRCFLVRLDQYAKIGIHKPQEYELKEDGVTEAHKVEYSFGQNMQNEAIFDKWLDKLNTVKNCHLLNEKRGEYWANIHQIQSTIWTCLKK